MNSSEIWNILKQFRCQKIHFQFNQIQSSIPLVLVSMKRGLVILCFFIPSSEPENYDLYSLAWLFSTNIDSILMLLLLRVLKLECFWSLFRGSTGTRQVECRLSISNICSLVAIDIKGPKTG